MGRIIDRRRVMGGEKLPYDAEIEYLESDGTQWIDTLISPDPTTGVKGIVMGTIWGGYHNELCLGCSENGVFASGKGFAYDLKHNAYVGGTRTGLPYNANINQWYSFELNYLNSGVCYDTIMNSTVNINIGNQSTSLTMFLFKMSQIGGISPYCVKGCRFGKVQFTKGSNIVRDFVPVRIGQVGYMYDKVSKQFFGNAGTGAFILGPDKRTEEPVNVNINVKTHSTGSSDASLDVITGDGEPFNIVYSYYTWNNGYIGINYSRPNWQISAITPCLYDGQVYQSGDLIETWAYTETKDINIVANYEEVL